MAAWKRDFASGLIILVPILVTVVVLVWIYSRLARIPIPVDSEPVRVALSILIFILLVFSVGYLMRTALGAVLESALDDLMNSLPGLRVIYNASKMAVETALSGTSELTGNTTADGREILFLPTAPNITTGFVIEVEPDRYTEIDDNVEDALTRLISAGFGDNTDDSLAQLVENDQVIGGDRQVPHDRLGETVPEDDGGSQPSETEG
ncbi:hypothetical protein BRC66_06645 [Halobacteriales archaeon QH_2_66_30]|nr:MAG: hypothetical protein BRC66_06645 [Halobacteriales archaeon QH_2_66_30]